MEETSPPLPPAEVAEDAVTPTSEEVKASIIREVREMMAWIMTCQSLTFFAFETQLVPKSRPR